MTQRPEHTPTTHHLVQTRLVQTRLVQTRLVQKENTT